MTRLSLREEKELREKAKRDHASLVQYIVYCAEVSIEELKVTKDHRYVQGNVNALEALLHDIVLT